jgi:hypothetical protein
VSSVSEETQTAANLGGWTIQVLENAQGGVAFSADRHGEDPIVADTEDELRAEMERRATSNSE